MEDVVLLEIEKVISSMIVNAGMQNEYESRVQFLKSIDIFADVDTFILLPLACNIMVKTYKIGQYIVKAGEEPEGLVIVSKGRVKLCAEKIALRSIVPSCYSKFQQMPANMKVGLMKYGTKDKFDNKSENSSEADDQEFFSDPLQKVNLQQRTFQGEEILVDDNGQRIKEYIVYKDLMEFNVLLSRSYFGSRVLLPPGIKKDYESNNYKKRSDQRRQPWIISKQQASGNFEHMFIKRRMSFTSQNILKNERNSMLSVIADSADVEVFVISNEMMEFFPE